MVNAPAALPPGKIRYPRAGLEGAETLASSGIQSPYFSAHSESLYRLAIPAHRKVIEGRNISYLLELKALRRTGILVTLNTVK
jgi:hypothetical protein